MEYHFKNNMQINRHNYETIFLLYVDKELSAAERNAVELFVKENPDLQMELDLLQQTVCKTDGVVLDKKDWLYMKEEITVLQENLLLYADDELTGLYKELVEELITSDGIAKSEWNILKQTKLQPDTSIVFADKQSLYRREGGRVIGIAWWRAAAAAVLLGFGLWTGLLLYKNYNRSTTGKTELANNNEINTGQKTPGVPVKPVTVIPEPGEKNTIGQLASATAPLNKNKPGIENLPVRQAGSQAVGIKNSKEKTVTLQENLVVQSSNNEKHGKRLTLPTAAKTNKSYLENINKNESNETIVATVLSENNSNRVSGNNMAEVKINTNANIINTISNKPRGEKTDPPVVVSQAVNKKADAQSNSRYINIDDDKEKRTALGGFLRKAKRVLERTTNINTGEGIKVAGFEIALK